MVCRVYFDPPHVPKATTVGRCVLLVDLNEGKNSVALQVVVEYLWLRLGAELEVWGHELPLVEFEALEQIRPPCIRVLAESDRFSRAAFPFS